MNQFGSSIDTTTSFNQREELIGFLLLRLIKFLLLLLVRHLLLLAWHLLLVAYIHLDSHRMLRAQAQLKEGGLPSAVQRFLSPPEPDVRSKRPRFLL